MLKFAVFALLVASASAGLINFTPCNSAGRVISVDVEGCSMSDARCIFKKGETYNIDTEFQAGTSGSAANLEVKASVSIITVDIIKPGGDNGCPGLSHHHGACTYASGSTYRHRTTMTISDQFIETDATVTLRILNASNGAEVCFSAPARVTA